MSYNVAQLLDQRATTQPSHAAVKMPFRRNGKLYYQTLTFAELTRLSSDVAHHLQANGLQPNDRCLLLLRPGIELIAICFALFRIGAVPVVIDPGMGVKSFLRCVKKVEPSCIIGLPQAIFLSKLFFTSFRAVKQKFSVSNKWIQKIPHKDHFPVQAQSADQLAAILFTSGSTGAPKGVCYEHSMFAQQVEMIRAAYQIEEGEIDLPMLPIFSLFNPALGMTTIVPEMNPSRPASVDPRKIIEAIQQNAVTNSFGSPALWAKIGRYCLAHQVTLPSLRRILMAGAPVPPSVLKMYQTICPQATIHTPYGATECLPVSSISSTEVLEDTWAKTVQGKGTCVGKPLPGVEIEIQTPDPQGIGEIVVHGPTVTKEYFRLPEATAQAKFYEDGKLWHRMGDLGYRDNEGRIWFCGRKVEAVSAHGKMYYTDCVEAIFNQHPKVFRTALIRYRELPALVIELFPEHQKMSETERSSFLEELSSLGQQSPATADIQHFFFEKAFPVDVRHNAKIHRLSLTKKLSNQTSHVLQK